jgi:hypothetical protein
MEVAKRLFKRQLHRLVIITARIATPVGFTVARYFRLLTRNRQSTRMKRVNARIIYSCIVGLPDITAHSKPQEIQ